MLDALRLCEPPRLAALGTPPNLGGEFFVGLGVCWFLMLKLVALSVALAFCLASMTACAQRSGQGASATVPKLDTDEQKTLYTLGILLGRNIKPFALTPDELAIVQSG